MWQPAWSCEPRYLNGVAGERRKCNGSVHEQPQTQQATTSRNEPLHQSVRIAINSLEPSAHQRALLRTNEHIWPNGSALAVIYYLPASRCNRLRWLANLALCSRLVRVELAARALLLLLAAPDDPRTVTQSTPCTLHSIHPAPLCMFVVLAYTNRRLIETPVANPRAHRNAIAITPPASDTDDHHSTKWLHQKPFDDNCHGLRTIATVDVAKHIAPY